MALDYLGIVEKRIAELCIAIHRSKEHLKKSEQFLTRYNLKELLRTMRATLKINYAVKELIQSRNRQHRLEYPENQDQENPHPLPPLVRHGTAH